MGDDVEFHVEESLSCFGADALASRDAINENREYAANL
jgi:hypothetical protein